MLSGTKAFGQGKKKSLLWAKVAAWDLRSKLRQSYSLWEPVLATDKQEEISVEVVTCGR